MVAGNGRARLVLADMATLTGRANICPLTAPYGSLFMARCLVINSAIGAITADALTLSIFFWAAKRTTLLICTLKAERREVRNRARKSERRGHQNCELIERSKLVNECSDDTMNSPAPLVFRLIGNIVLSVILGNHVLIINVTALVMMV